MKGSTVRLNEWEVTTLKQIAKVKNDKRRIKGQKEMKQSEVLHELLERVLPQCLLNEQADEEDSKQTLLL